MEDAQLLAGCVSSSARWLLHVATSSRSSTWLDLSTFRRCSRLSRSPKLATTRPFPCELVNLRTKPVVVCARAVRATEDGIAQLQLIVQSCRLFAATRTYHLRDRCDKQCLKFALLVAASGEMQQGPVPKQRWLVGPRAPCTTLSNLRRSSPEGLSLAKADRPLNTGIHVAWSAQSASSNCRVARAVRSRMLAKPRSCTCQRANAANAPTPPSR